MQGLLKAPCEPCDGAKDLGTAKHPVHWHCVFETCGTKTLPASAALAPLSSLSPGASCSQKQEGYFLFLSLPGLHPAMGLA